MRKPSRRVQTIVAILLVTSLLLMGGSASVQAAGPPEKVKVFVVFNRHPGPSEQAIIHRAGGSIKYTYDIVPALAASVPSTAIPGLMHNPNVVLVEPVVRAQAADAELDNTWGVKRIGAGLVHDGNNKGAGVKVGVIDSGVDCGHPELSASCAGGHDFVNDDEDATDDFGHGTHVAGTIAARDNGLGVVGVAPEAKIYAYKVLGADGGGGYDDIIAALERAVKDGVQVTNNSYVSGDPGQTVKKAFDNAYDAGVLHVAAAGNAGTPDASIDNVLYPARFRSVIAVGATDITDSRASFSSTGPDVEFAAPGVSVVSTTMGGGYEAWNGTSMATPHVAGAAALVISSGISGPGNVRARLQETAYDLGSAGLDTQFGYGLVSASSAAPPPQGLPVVSIASPADGTTFFAGSAIAFAGSAGDSKDGDLTSSLKWTSSIDGAIGTGGSFTRVLSQGTHTITASVADSDGNLDGESVSVRVAATSASVGTVRVNAGGGSYVGSKGLAWSADTAYWLGGRYSTTSGIARTTDDPLYQSERYGNFGYNLAVPPGKYKVTLKFAEIFHTQKGQRIFDVSIEGERVLSNFDILAYTKPNTPLDRSFTVTVSPDGILDVDFTTVKDNAKVSAIEVVRVP